MKEMIEQFDACLNGIQEVRNSINEISERSSTLVEASERLEEILRAISEQRDAIEQGIDGFAELSTRAKNAFPLIEERLDTLTTQFGESVNSTIEGARQAGARMEEITTRTTEKMSEHMIAFNEAAQNALANAMGTFAGQMASLSEKFVEDYTPLTERLARIINISEGRHNA